jgi:hypothetical protein
VIEPEVSVPDHSDEALKANLFPHEYDLIGNLRRFPLVVRYRLDCMQLYMSLDSWQLLPYQDRLALASAPFATALERETLATTLQIKVLQVPGAELKTECPEPMADYLERDRVPEQIESALAHLRLAISVEQWQALPELARFGLAKLSRHGHDNRRLGPLIDDLLYTAVVDLGGPPAGRG